MSCPRQHAMYRDVLDRFAPTSSQGATQLQKYPWYESELHRSVIVPPLAGLARLRSWSFYEYVTR